MNTVNTIGMKHFVLNIELNAKSCHGLTPLLSTCQNGHKDVVKLLLNNLNKNIDTNTRNDHGMTTFQLACS